MSQLFTTHEIEKCEICDGDKIEIGVNVLVCPFCGSREDNF